MVDKVVVVVVVVAGEMVLASKRAELLSGGLGCYLPDVWIGVFLSDPELGHWGLLAVGGMKFLELCLTELTFQR